MSINNGTIFKVVAYNSCTYVAGIPSHVAPVSTTLADEHITNAVHPSLDVAMATESDGNVLPKSNTANDSSIPELNTNTNVAIELQVSYVAFSADVRKFTSCF